MISYFERLVALRYLGAKKSEGFVSVIAAFSFLGILLGVATLIIVMAVMNGFRDELITRVLGINGHVMLYGQDGVISDYQDIADDVLRQTGIEGVYPGIEKQALMTIDGRSAGVLVRGLSQSDFQRKPVMSTSVKQGSLIDYVGPSIAIGSEMAERYNLEVGDAVNLLSPKGKASPFGTIPKSRSFTVSVIFSVDMFEYDSNFVFMPLPAAQQFFELQNAVNMIEVFTADASRPERYEARIRDIVPPSIRTLNWQTTNGSFFSALQVERNVMFMILTLIILVAAFNIISSMIMLVRDKTSDIAVLRTMGAYQGSLMKIFVITGASIGFIGTFAGAVLGILFSMNIETIREFLEGLSGTELFSAEVYFLSQLPAKIDWVEVMAVVIMAFVLSFLATLYPAWRASRIDPVEALRYE